MKALNFIAIPKANNEVLAAARKRRQMNEVVIEQRLEIEVSERQARSIRYRMTQARFPQARNCRFRSNELRDRLMRHNFTKSQRPQIQHQGGSDRRQSLRFGKRGALLQ